VPTPPPAQPLQVRARAGSTQTCDRRGILKSSPPPWPSASSHASVLARHSQPPTNAPDAAKSENSLRWGHRQPGSVSALRGAGAFALCSIRTTPRTPKGVVVRGCGKRRIPPGHDRYRIDQSHPAHRLDRSSDRSHRPVWQMLGDLPRQSINPPFRIGDRVNVILQHDLLGRAASGPRSIVSLVR